MPTMMRPDTIDARGRGFVVKWDDTGRVRYSQAFGTRERAARHLQEMSFRPEYSEIKPFTGEVLSEREAALGPLLMNSSGLDAGAELGEDE